MSFSPVQRPNVIKYPKRFNLTKKQLHILYGITCVVFLVAGFSIGFKWGFNKGRDLKGSEDALKAYQMILDKVNLEQKGKKNDSS